MPILSDITMRDCARASWELHTYCDTCRSSSQANLGPLAAAPAGDKPIRALFEARKLTCRTCKQPFAGVDVWRKGPVPLDCVKVITLYREGSDSDPEVKAYWKGYRVALGRQEA